MPEDQSSITDSSAEQSDTAQAGTVRTCKLPIPSSADSEAKRFSKYAIVGEYIPKRDDGFVKHVALLADAGQLDGAAEKDVFHMGPPPHAGETTALLEGVSTKMTPQLVGDLALTNDECEAIDNWLATVDAECGSYTLPILQYYKIRPHMETRVSEEGRRRPPRFNCSGFVIEAYRDAGIELLDTSSIPKVSSETLQPAYRFFFVVESRESSHEKYGFEGREDLGVDDAEEWDVVLPGYLFHSTDRATDENPRPSAPFVPEARHAYYPCSDFPTETTEPSA